MSCAGGVDKLMSQGRYVLSGTPLLLVATRAVVLVAALLTAVAATSLGAPVSSTATAGAVAAFLAISTATTLLTVTVAAATAWMDLLAVFIGPWRLCSMLTVATAATVSSTTAVATTAVSSAATRSVVAAAALVASTRATAGALRGFVDTNSASVKPDTVSNVFPGPRHALIRCSGGNYFDLLDFVHARDCSLRLSVALETDEAEASAAAGVAVFDNNLGRELVHQGFREERCERMYRFFDNSEFLELGAQGGVICVPSEAASRDVSRSRGSKQGVQIYPMKSFDMMNEALEIF